MTTIGETSFEPQEEENQEQENMYEDYGQNDKDTTGQNDERDNQRRQAQQALDIDDDDNQPREEIELKEIVEKIDNESLRNKIKKDLGYLRDQDEISTSIFRNMLLEGIEDTKIEDKLVKSKWENSDEDSELINENDRVSYQEKLDNINQALENEGVFLDGNNRRVQEFLEDFEKSYTDKNKKFNGYDYDGKKIVRTNVHGKLYLVDSKESANIKKHLIDLTKQNAKSEIISLIDNDSELSAEGAAADYIEVLRDQQKSIIENIKDEKDIKTAIRDINFLEEEIEKIKKNERVKIDPEKFKKTTRGALLDIKKTIKKHKVTLGAGAVGLIVSIVSSVVSSIPIVDKLKSGLKQIGKLGSLVEKVGKQIKSSASGINYFLEAPADAIASLLGLTGNLIKEAAFYPLTIILLILILVFVRYYRV